MGALRVAVIGAGPGGLCLAQGLRRAGIEVTVYERDAELGGRRQGYRLHLDGRAGLALHECLPAELFDLFLATSGQPSTAFTVLSARLRVLHRVAADPTLDPDAPRTLSTSVNRGTLREVLMSGLGERVRFGHELVRYTDDGATVGLRFADGSRATADVLVGADGINSTVRRQLLPSAEILDTGGRVVYGRTPLTETTMPLVPAAMLDGFTAIVGGRVGVAAGLVRIRTPPDEAAARLSPVDDYLMWAVSAQHDRFPIADGRLVGLAATELHEVARRMVRSWHPQLRALVAHADVPATFLVRVRTSVPVPAWPPGRVTLLGDAIHAMSPARGSGANTALRDAGLLARLLGAAVPESGTGPAPAAILSAIGGYEEQMREYGFAEVRASREAEQSFGGHGLLRRLLRPRQR